MDEFSMNAGESRHGLAPVSERRDRSCDDHLDGRSASADARASSSAPRRTTRPSKETADATDATVVICTYNRAHLLRQTLTSIAELLMPPEIAWDVLVVDNNSTDDTAAVVQSIAGSFPVALRYCFERRQGRSCAMNAAIAHTQAAIVAFTDDDVVVERGWLAAAIEPLRGGDSDLAYTGGPVHPMWETAEPGWFAAAAGVLRGTLALLDYGSQPFVFEERRLVPLGVNLAMRRNILTRVGGFNTSFGRAIGAVPLGQEVPEFLVRVRTAGAYGKYVPGMIVHHHVPAHRLTPAYWRRWWYGKGLSRARLEMLHPITELGVDLRAVPQVFGMPRFLFGNALRDAAGWCSAMVTRDFGRRVGRESQLCYFAGQVIERCKSRARGSRSQAVAESSRSASAATSSGV